MSDKLMQLKSMREFNTDEINRIEHSESGEDTSKYEEANNEDAFEPQPWRLVMEHL